MNDCEAKPIRPLAKVQAKLGRVDRQVPTKVPPKAWAQQRTKCPITCLPKCFRMPRHYGKSGCRQSVYKSLREGARAVRMSTKVPTTVHTPLC